MKCDLCGKNEATVHLTEIIDEAITELHICEECAKKKGAQMEQQFDFADLLAGLAEFGGLAQQPQQASVPSEQCSVCGMTYEEFKKLGRFGCSNCYKVFKAHIIPLLKRIQGATQHVGKLPRRSPTESKIMEKIKELKLQLERAVELEDFETAAALRDQINEIKKKRDQDASE